METARSSVTVYGHKTKEEIEIWLKLSSAVLPALVFIAAFLYKGKVLRLIGITLLYIAQSHIVVLVEHDGKYLLVYCQKLASVIPARIFHHIMCCCVAIFFQHTKHAVKHIVYVAAVHLQPFLTVLLVRIHALVLGHNPQEREIGLQPVHYIHRSFRMLVISLCCSSYPCHYRMLPQVISPALVIVWQTGKFLYMVKHGMGIEQCHDCIGTEVLLLVFNQIGYVHNIICFCYSCKVI